MCDPVTLAIVGASAGGGFESIMGVMDLTNRISQQDDLNNAIEASYNAEVTAARNKALLDQMNLNQQTQTENLKNQQEKTQANKEALENTAAAEAAASALNVAGNTAQRTAAVADVNTLNREGAFEARGEGITTQHMMNSLAIKDTYENDITGAKLKADASWRPMTSGWLMETLGLSGSIVSGAASGAQAGYSAGSAYQKYKADNPKK